ncbi:MAG: hypothetical protein EOP06_27375, partial [Proteobacteria bacterium]
MNKPKLLFLAACLVLAARIIWIHPTLLSSKTFALPPTTENGIWETISMKSMGPKAGPAHTFENYRGNDKRTAQYRVPSIPKDLKLMWSSEPFNIGIHAASKASPAVDLSGVYAGGDNSWFYAWDPSGEVRWKTYLAESSRGIHSTASLDGASVFVGSYRGAVYRFAKETGALEWSRIVGNTIGASPLLDESGIV